MPRYRRVRQPKVKQPKPVKIPRPKVKDLRMILKGLMTVSQANRIASLVYALQWYDTVIPYLIQKGKLDPNAKRQLEIAVKCRKQGIGSPGDNEKEVSFLTAIRNYEKACRFLKPMPVDKFYDLFNAQKDKLEAKQSRLESKFGNVTTLLQKAIGDKVKLVVADAKKPFQYDGALSSVTYNRDAAKALSLKFRQEGILAVLVDQLPILAQHKALEPDGNGGWQYDAERHVAIVEEMLQSFIQFAKGKDAPKRLVRNFVPSATAPRVAVPGQPRAPQGPRTSSPRPLVGKRDVPGSRKRAEMVSMVYERIKDGQEHATADVLVGVDSPSRIKQLERYGVLWGDFTVTINKDKVVLKHTVRP